MTTTTALIQRLLARGWTQTAICKRTGIPQPRLSRWAQSAPDAADDALKLYELARDVETDQQAQPQEARDAT